MHLDAIFVREGRATSIGQTLHVLKDEVAHQWPMQENRFAFPAEQNLLSGCLVVWASVFNLKMTFARTSFGIIDQILYIPSGADPNSIVHKK